MPDTTSATLRATQALQSILARVSKIDRESKAAEYTDLDAVWHTLYAIRADATRALAQLRSSQR